MAVAGRGGGFGASGGGFQYKGIGIGGASGGSDATPAAESRQRWRTAVNVNNYGADPTGVSDSFDAFVTAVARAKASNLPLYAPGNYIVELSEGFDEADGQILIDFGGLEIFGDGKDRSSITVTAPTTPVSRRLSMADDTVRRGTVATIGVNTMTLDSLAEANTFQIGDNLKFTSSAGVLRVKTVTSAGGVNNVVSTPGTTITFNGSADIVGGVQIGDFVYWQYKMYLQNPGDYLQFSDGCGIRVSPNADGTGFRTTSNGRTVIKVLSVDEAGNALNLLLNYDTVAGFADGDYVYIVPNSLLFKMDLNEDSATTPFDFTMHDISIYGTNFGIDQRFTTGATDIGTGMFRVFPEFASAVEMLPARFRFYDMTVEGFGGQFRMNDGSNFANPHISWEFERCDLSGASSSFTIFYDDNIDYPDIYVCVHNCWVHDINGSHVAYIHSNISLQWHESRFERIAHNKEVINHFGANHNALHVSITDNWFGPGIGGRAYLTGQHGSWSFTGNTIESGSIAFRGGQGVVAFNTFRPDGYSAISALCISSYNGAWGNQSININTNMFDFGRMPTAWVTATAYDTEKIVTQGGYRYRCIVAGTSGGTGPSAGAMGTNIADGATLRWEYLGAPLWLANTYYFIDDQVWLGGNTYTCTGQGTSAGAGGPTGTGSAPITDGGVTWSYAGQYGSPTGTCLLVEYYGRYTFRNNDVTANNQTSTNNAPIVHAGQFSAVAINANGANITTATIVDVIDNRVIFEPSAGQQWLLSSGWNCAVRVKDNKFVGRASSTGAPIRLVASGLGGASGLTVIDNNDIDVTAGNGIASAGEWTGTPALAITRNRILTRTASRNPISLIHTGTAAASISLDTEVSGNNLDGQSLAIVVGSAIAAGSVWGSENRFNGDLIDTTNAQRLLPRRSLLTTTVTAATSTSLNADFDTFRLADTGAVTIDTLLLGGAASAQLAFDGAMVTLIFTTGNITLGAGGNITAAGGARTAGTACRLVYSTALVKWVEL